MSNGRGNFSAGSMAWAFLIGGAVGAGLAFLFHPEAGPETREKIREKAGVAKEGVLKVAEEVKDKTEDFLEKGKEVIEDKKSVLESALEAGKKAMEREKGRIRSAMGKGEAEEQEETDVPGV